QLYLPGGCPRGSCGSARGSRAGIRGAGRPPRRARALRAQGSRRPDRADARASRVPAGLVLCVALAGAGEDLLRVVAVAPAARLRPFRRLEVLVALEEVLDLVAQLVLDVVDVGHSFERRVARRDTQELLVRTLLVLHVEDADRAHPDPAAREGRVGDEDERVERVSVLGERPLDEAVVGGIRHRGEEPAVEDDAPELVVPLV